MSSKFFGQYLLSNKLVNSLQLATALTEQETLNRRLGELAIEQNLLDEKQVYAILDLQKNENIFFGEGSIKLGYLSPEQVNTLLTLQAKQHVCLGEVIVTLGYLTKEERDKALDEFIREQGQREKILEPFSSIDGFEKERPFLEKFKEHALKILQRMSGVFMKFDGYKAVKSAIELPAFLAQLDNFNEQGERVTRYMLLLDIPLAQILHSKICRRNNVDDISVSTNASLCELLNILCCTNFQMPAKITASVPKVLEGSFSYTCAANETAMLVSFATPYGPIRFLLSFTGVTAL